MGSEQKGQDAPRGWSLVTHGWGAHRWPRCTCTRHPLRALEEEGRGAGGGGSASLVLCPPPSHPQEAMP